MASAANQIDVEQELEQAAGRFYADPRGYVIYAFPWGEPGELEHEEGPDKWQCEFLDGIGAEVKANMTAGQSFPWRPIRRAVSSGHGIGKSTMVAWLVNWIMVTRPRSVGTITANTFTQLETKTWAAIQRWNRLSIYSHWFECTSRLLYEPGERATWYCSPQSSKEENSEAFAGQHSKPATSFYCFDEDSAIPDKIHEVAEGGLTDGEPMVFLFGNPTRNSGHFYNACFRDGSRWNPTIVDSRDSRFTNKEQIAEWIQDYGEDSDFVRVRVRGIHPNASDAQFIDQERVRQAQKRQVVVLPDEPLVAGADLAWGGSDDNVIRFRRGMDARSIPSIRIKGEFTRDPGVLTNRLGDVLSQTYDGQKVAMLFLDSAGIAGPIGSRLRTLGFRNVQEVNFGTDSPDTKYRYMRDCMWGRMKEWLLSGAIDNHPELEADLTGPGIRPDNRQRVWLESKETMKKRGLDSPDDGDALCFVAGTLVETDHGPRPIESIRVGDRVKTPFGPTPVMTVHQSDTQSLTTARFSEGQVLTGKGEHKLFTFSRGRQRLDALSLTDEVEILSWWRLRLWQLVKLCSTAARSSGFKAAVDTFSPGTPVRRKDFCIGGFGAITTALSQKVTRFITSIMTGGTIGWPILSYVLPGHTSVNTWSSAPAIRSSVRSGWNGWQRAESAPLNGIGQMRAALGTPSTANGLGLAGLHLPSCVPAVGSSSLPSSPAGRSTARRLACRLSRFVGISLTFVSVRTAVIDSWRIVIGRRPVVPVFVQTDIAPVTRTYNLTLAEHNAYYANGILVFNCLTFAAPIGVPVKSAPANVPHEFAWS